MLRPEEASEPRRRELATLAKNLGRPVDEGLLGLALAHRSWCAEVGNDDSNERLELLGDAVLGLVVTDHLYRAYPHLAEGDLAKIRAVVVSAPTLAKVAIDLGIGDELMLGKGEDASGGRQKTSILSDALEAVIGAVYLDGGWDAAAPLVMRLLGDHIAEAATGPGGGDHKTRLQELVVRIYNQLPRYVVSHEGPDHARRYFATVEVGGVERGRGEGRSKKQAEQAAARCAWEELAVPGSTGGA